jgi:hypothetical protein
MSSGTSLEMPEIDVNQYRSRNLPVGSGVQTGCIHVPVVGVELQQRRGGFVIIEKNE